MKINGTLKNVDRARYLTKISKQKELNSSKQLPEAELDEIEDSKIINDTSLD